ncbi:MAG TPA: glycosyltransferase family A protein [Limnochordia bacterium]|nr:glycosyltransferase family A protein [Limnochordia bacterium]
MSIDVSVVIPTHNRARIVERSLAALERQTLARARYELVVVDDGSRDETPKRLQEWAAEGRVRALTLPPSGRAAARNAGIRAAVGWLIVFIDDDIIVTAEFLAAHLAAHTPDDRLIGHGPVIHTTDLERATETPAKLTDISRAFFATGNASIRKAHLLEAGLFDEAFVEYGWEDLELGQRLRELNLTAVKVPEARGYHYKPALKVSQLEYLRRREQQRARTAMLFYRRRPTKRTRGAIMMHPVFFAVDRLLNAFNWTARPGVTGYLKRQEAKGRTGWVRFLVRSITLHEYLQTLKGEMQKLEQEERPGAGES